MTVGRVVPVLNIIKDRSTNMYRVLITDDEKIEREGIKFLLAQEEGEYEIHEAANGRQALNVLRSEEIDFLLRSGQSFNYTNELLECIEFNSNTKPEFISYLKEFPNLKYKKKIE